jgi:hypothetical protein
LKERTAFVQNIYSQINIRASRKKSNVKNVKSAVEKYASSFNTDLGTKVYPVKKLNEGQNLYKQLFNESSDFIFIHPIDHSDNPGCFTDVNKTVIKKLGYSIKEIQKLKPADIVIDDNLKEIPAKQKKLVNNKKFYSKKFY